jgi:hypothetical protein
MRTLHYLRIAALVLAGAMPLMSFGQGASPNITGVAPSTATLDDGTPNLVVTYSGPVAVPPLDALPPAIFCASPTNPALGGYIFPPMSPPPCGGPSVPISGYMAPFGLTTNPTIEPNGIAGADITSALGLTGVGHGGQVWFMRAFQDVGMNLHVAVVPLRVYTTGIVAISGGVGYSGTVSGATGGVVSAGASDLVDTYPADAFRSTMTIFNAGGLTGLTADVNTNTINVPGGQSISGLVNVTYKRCQAYSNTSNCATVNVAITVTPAVVANPDTVTLPATGGTINVLANDTIGGAAATISNASVSLQTTGGISQISVNASGQVVIGSGVTPGSYAPTYLLCQISTANCSAGLINLTIASVVVVAASNLGFTRPAGPSYLLDILPTPAINTGATIGGSPATTSNADVSLINNTIPGATLNSSLQVVVPAGVAPGSYSTDYQLCQKGTPNCVTRNLALVINASVTAVGDSAALPSTGGTVNILANDLVNSSPATTSNGDVTIQSNGGLTGASINASGQLVIAAGAASGVYTVTYRLCAKNTSTCQTASVTITVLAQVTAVADSATFTTQGGVINILANDFIGSVPASLSNASVALVNSGGANGATINASGQLVIPAGLPPGSYTLVYQLCQRGASLPNCANASVTVQLSPPVIAVPDNATLPGTGGLVNILGNDTVNGAPATTVNGDVTIVSVGAATGTILTAAGQLSVPTGLVAGTYVVSYRLCQKGTAFCATANATIVINVTPGAFVLKNDTVTMSPNGGTVNVLSNDTLDGRTLTALDVTLSISSTGGVAVTLNADGVMTIPSGLASALYTIGYRACQKQLPSNCATAIVYVTIIVGATGTTSGRPPSAPGTGTTTTTTTVIGPSGSPITFTTASGGTSAGAANDPIAFSLVKLVFGESETGKVQAFYQRNDPIEAFGAQLTYSGSGTLRGRWEVVYPGEPLPSELDLVPEASLPISLRQQQQRFFLVDRVQTFLSPLGRIFLKGPDPARLPKNLPGRYLILLRIEATPGPSGTENGKAGFAFPMLAYTIQESNVRETPAQAKARAALTVNAWSVADFSSLGEIGRGTVRIDGSSLKPSAVGQGFVGLAPAPIGLMLPQAAGSIARDKPLTFSWADIPDAAQYRFELATAAGRPLLVTVVAPGVATYTAPPLLRDDVPPGTLVQWRVLAINK